MEIFLTKSTDNFCTWREEKKNKLRNTDGKFYLEQIKENNAITTTNEENKK